MIDGRGREVPVRATDPLAKLVPPPTVEYRQVGNVPYALGLLLYTMLSMGAGILMGWAMRGGGL